MIHTFKKIVLIISLFVLVISFFKPIANAQDIILKPNNIKTDLENRSKNNKTIYQQINYQNQHIIPILSARKNILIDFENKINIERQAEAQKKLDEAKIAEAKTEIEKFNPIATPIDNVSVKASVDYGTLIDQGCAKNGCNTNQLLRVMWCESGGRSNAYNPSGASGLFQFMPRTFSANAQRVGISTPNIWNPEQQIEVATWMFARGQAGQWSCK